MSPDNGANPRPKRERREREYPSSKHFRALKQEVADLRTRLAKVEQRVVGASIGGVVLMEALRVGIEYLQTLQHR